MTKQIITEADVQEWLNENRNGLKTSQKTTRFGELYGVIQPGFVPSGKPDMFGGDGWMEDGGPFYPGNSWRGVLHYFTDGKYPPTKYD